MLVVSNTSPLSNLAIIGRLGLVREQLGHVLIPPAVRAEIGRNPHAEARATMEADPTKAYNQGDATGFIQLNALRLKATAKV